MAETNASFYRRDQDGSAHFEVTPARTSLSYLLVLGPASLLGVIIVSVIGGAVGGTVGALVSIIGSVVFLWFRFWRSFVKNQEHRKPATISVGNGGLKSGTEFFPVNEIVELNIRQGIAGLDSAPLASTSSFIVFGKGALGAAAAYGAHVGNVVGRGIDKAASAWRMQHGRRNQAVDSKDPTMSIDSQRRGLGAGAMRRALATVAMVLLSGDVMAAQDWLDEMPTVAAVAQALRAKIDSDRQSQPELAGDEGYHAAQLAGSFVLLRWVLMFQASEDGAMSSERITRARAVGESYIRAEKAIGLGIGKRPGRDQRICANQPGMYGGEGPPMYATAEECLRERFRLTFRGVTPDFMHREALFPLLFCERSAHYLALVMRHVLKAPRLSSPAETPAVSAVEQATAVGLCAGHGDDGNGNGICDEWEQPMVGGRVAAVSARSCGQAAGPSTLVKTCDHPLLGQCYKTLKEAAYAGLREAWRMSLEVAKTGEQQEFGGYVYQIAPNDFRFVEPTAGKNLNESKCEWWKKILVKSADEWICSGPRKVLLSVDMKEDFEAKVKRVLASQSTPKPVAIYHSHPPEIRPSYLSINDLNYAVEKGYSIYMIGYVNEDDSVGVQKYTPIRDQKGVPDHKELPPIEPEAICDCYKKDENDLAAKQEQGDGRRSAIEELPAP